MKFKTEVHLFCCLAAMAAFVVLPSVVVAQTEQSPATSKEVTLEVFARKRELLKITSNWPKSFMVENISDQEISGFSISIIAADDEGGLGRMVNWGTNPNYSKQSPLLKPKDKVEVIIPDEVVRTFELNGKPLVYAQLGAVWVNNDPTIMYHHGSIFMQDPNNPKRYVVMVNANGEYKDYLQP